MIHARVGGRVDAMLLSSSWASRLVMATYAHRFAEWLNVLVLIGVVDGRGLL